jgi:hypothetical protein
VEVSVPAQVDQVLELAAPIGEGEALSVDEVVGAGWGGRYYWRRARGNSTTPPRKSVKFW